ncbi:MAG: CHRD domain-containing protein, partial [Nitriliruptor sp.]
MRKTLTTLAATGAMLALPIAASAQTPTTFTANLTQANESGASGTATVTLDGTTATVRVDGNNFFDGFPHAMHIHGEPGGDNVCGPLNPSDSGFDAADEDGDGILSVAEGVPAYGGIQASLTTEGDTSPDSGLAVERFPTSGTLDYERTFEVSQDVADNMSSLHVVVHATDLNDSGEIGDQGTPSSLDPDLDIEATAPAACGQLVASAAGGVATGAGGTTESGSTTGAIAAGALGLAALGAFGARRRKVV